MSHRVRRHGFIAVVQLLLFVSLVYAQTNEVRRRAEEAFKRGEVEFDTHRDLRAARQSFQRSVELARKLDNQSLTAHSAYRLAHVLLELEEYELALDAAGLALKAAQLSGDRGREAWALDMLGNAYHHKGDHTQALTNFEAALPLMREVGDRFGEATALKDVGITHRFLGQLERGLEPLQQSLDIFRQLNALPQVASSLDNLGTAYVYLGAYGQALDAHRQALEVGRKIMDLKQLTSSLTRMGYVHLELDDPEPALSFFQEALTLAEKLKQRESIGWALMGISDTYSALGQEDSAIAAQQRSLEVQRRVNYESGMVSNYRNLGYLYLPRDPAISLDYFERALVLQQKLNSPVVWPIYVGFARAFRRQNDLDRAIDFYEKALTGLESTSAQILSEERKAGFIGKHYRIYQELLEALLERHRRAPEAGDDLRAYNVYERAKARAMLDSIVAARADLSEGLAPDLQQRHKALDAQAAELHQRISQPELTSDERQSALTAVSEVEGGRERLIVEIKRRSPRYAAVQYPQPLSATQTRSALDDETAVVAYAFTSERVFAFVLTVGGLHVEQLPVSPQVLEARVQSYVQLIAKEGQGSGWMDVSRRLYAELVAPIRGQIPSTVRRLILIPDGLLYYLPFESLIWNQLPSSGGLGAFGNVKNGPDAPRSTPGARYLLEEFVISYVPSATVLAELTKNAGAVGPDRADLLIFANPSLVVASRSQSETLVRALYDDEGLHMSPIPFTAAEAIAVRRHAGEGSEIYTGENATERRLKASDLKRFRVIHFATHGFVSRRAPARSALVLAPAHEVGEDGFLQVREVYQLKLASDLVVLSACQTARGQIVVGEGVQGLAQAFFYAGTQSVLASLWNVNDERTAELMAAFYRHLADGQDKATALNNAKRDLLRQAPALSPRYWAAFVMIGEADTPVLMKGPSWWQARGLGILAATLGVLSLVALLFYRRQRRLGDFTTSPVQ